MNYLENKSVVKRLHNGDCPVCGARLEYMSDALVHGELEKNGMPSTCETVADEHVVFCRVCKYREYAVQIGLKLIPEDRIVDFDPNWDKPYLEDNTLINGEKGKNPFYNKDKE